MARPKKPAVKGKKADAKTDGVGLYTLEVLLIDGIVSEEFVDENPVVSRTIQIRGDQTLDDLHEAIFAAFDRYDEHMYQFEFGTKPMDRKAVRYVMPGFDDMGIDDEAGGLTDRTRIDSLGLKVRGRFFYWFDFGDDWWHKITVKAIDAHAPDGEFPRVIKRVGESPPQYPQDDEDDEFFNEEE